MADPPMENIPPRRDDPFFFKGIFLDIVDDGKGGEGNGPVAKGNNAPVLMAGMARMMVRMKIVAPFFVIVVVIVIGRLMLIRDAIVAAMGVGREWW